MRKIILPWAILTINLALGLRIHGASPIEFITKTDLPVNWGSYVRCYANTNKPSVVGRLGQTGGPQSWNFSQSPNAREFVRRREIVAPFEDGLDGEFPTATYAERQTSENTGDQAWGFYVLNEDFSRDFLGLYDANANPAKPSTVYDQPSKDLPSEVRFGSTWQRVADWTDILNTELGQFTVKVHFTSQAVADAWGTISLPVLGSFSALRVNELHRLELTDLTFGLELPDQFVRYYYWLVPGIGAAVEILSLGQGSAPPNNFSTAADIQRVFQVRPGTARGLDLRINQGAVQLSWIADLDSPTYRIESNDSLGNTNWTFVAESQTNRWTGTFERGSRAKFLRVIVNP